jgi:hypothetical protein
VGLEPTKTGSAGQRLDLTFLQGQGEGEGLPVPPFRFGSTELTSRIRSL